MKPPPEEAELLGKRLRRDLPRGDEAPSYAAQRARLVQASARRGARPVGRYVGAAVMAAVAAVALAFVLSRAPQPQPIEPVLTFAVGVQERPGRVGEYYVAPRDAELPLRFSDGSQVVISERAGLRVSQAARQKTVVLLEGGAARFEVTPKSSGHWEIAAGPYVVRVTGTAFDLTWTAPTQALELQMRSGMVDVFGPGIEGGYRVRDRERFVTQVTAALVPSAPPATPRGAASSVPDAPQSEQQAVPPPPPSAAPSAKPDARADYRQVVEDARRRGLSKVLATAPAAELRALSDAARFSGQADVARSALLALRERFVGTAHARTAAFLLGRLADDAGDAHAAINWYDRHMQEGGDLLPEALGRKMLAQRRIGDAVAAKRTALDYAKRFPQGPYARQAQALADH